VKRGAVAKGKRLHDMGFSWRFTAVLSPTALFLPATNFEHFLGQCLSQKQKGEVNSTYSSDNPYSDLRWAFNSIVIEMITELLATSTFSSGCGFGTGGDPLRVALMPS
jgi:hypothetical protein